MLHDTATEADADAVERQLKKSGAKIHDRYHYTFKGFAVEVQDESLSVLKSNPFVASVEPDETGELDLTVPRKM